jgi:hypothetical protein
MRVSPIDTRGKEPAIDRQGRAGDEAARVGAEEKGGGNQFLRFAEPAKWGALEEFLAAWGSR